MPCCPECKNMNIVKEDGFEWCRNCGWTSDNRETPRIAATNNYRKTKY